MLTSTFGSFFIIFIIWRKFFAIYTSGNTITCKGFASIKSCTKNNTPPSSGKSMISPTAFVWKPQKRHSPLTTKFALRNNSMNPKDTDYQTSKPSSKKGRSLWWQTNNGSKDFAINLDLPCLPSFSCRDSSPAEGFLSGNASKNHKSTANTLRPYPGSWSTSITKNC